MKLHWRRVRFVALFLVVYLALSFAGFWLGMTTSTLGLRDGEPLPTFTTWQRFQGALGSAMIEVLWFPAFLAGRFLRPLPGSDWFWIIGSGILYGIMSLVLLEWLRARRSLAHPSTGANAAAPRRSV